MENIVICLVQKYEQTLALFVELDSRINRNDHSYCSVKSFAKEKPIYATGCKVLYQHMVKMLVVLKVI